MREIEVRIISAQELEDVKTFGKMRTYAVAYMDGQSKNKAATRVDEEGGINPTWNQVLVVKAEEEQLTHPLAALNVDIYARGHVKDKLVGTARVLISAFVNSSHNPIDCTVVAVRRPSGRPQGILNLWIPPAGKFLVRQDSLSFGRSDDQQFNDEDFELEFEEEAE